MIEQNYGRRPEGMLGLTSIQTGNTLHLIEIGMASVAILAIAGLAYSYGPGKPVDYRACLITPSAITPTEKK